MMSAYMWNGPICPRCGPYLQQGFIHTQQAYAPNTTTCTPTHQPRHRKPGPAQ